MSELLVDTGVWIDFLRGGDAALSEALLEERVIGHILVTGEIAMGSLADRSLPQAVRADDAEVLAMVEQRRLFILGLGCIDAHLLAATLLTAGQGWDARPAAARGGGGARDCGSGTCEAALTERRIAERALLREEIPFNPPPHIALPQQAPYIARQEGILHAGDGGWRPECSFLSVLSRLP
ncbi:PIN domain-containing protein [Sphingomonas immobilis]|uniref:PIN domain-containing protein n=1 Tax=Sphingomonas immobilis TaxID=3063997 RepID=A0ABT8ZXN5_9SPHN|nr:hypothetical protein [Sphingomonas sp. CA1-15]MDO7842340.1 hypothetical protein [Sphingomonas sp. CA1-15]